MKKIKLIFSLFFFLSTVLAHANSTLAKYDSRIVSDFDEAEIYNSFDEIAEIVNYIATTEEASYSDLTETDISLSNLSNTTAIASNAMGSSDQPPILSAFMWGCLTGPIGIVVVAVTTENNKEQVKSAAWGCALPAGCTALSYVAYYALVIAAYGTM